MNIFLTDLNSAFRDHGTVGLVDDSVNLLEVVRVRDHLVVGDAVLSMAGSARSPGFALRSCERGSYLVDDHIGDLNEMLFFARSVGKLRK
jgi:hypothetical protein